ncbi:MAG: CBS domain-containing protein [Chloroflexota bacterium]
MLFPLHRLLEGRAAPTCIGRATTVREALGLMIGHDFSQLPVVDAEGHFLGLVTEQTILRTYFHTDASAPLLDLTVDHCLVAVDPLSPDAHLVTALDRLKAESVVVVTEDDKPVGILTSYDANAFFREVTEGLLLVKEIEITLRQHIRNAFPTEEELEEAIGAAVHPDRRGSGNGTCDLKELSFNDLKQVILTRNNWPRFEPVFQSREVFYSLVDQARLIRNHLVHFKGPLEPIRYDALRCASRWLAFRPVGSPDVSLVEEESLLTVP